MSFAKFLRGVRRVAQKIGNGISTAVNFVGQKVLPAVSKIPIVGQLANAVMSNPLSAVPALAAGVGKQFTGLSGNGILDVIGGVGKAITDITNSSPPGEASPIPDPTK